MIREAEKTPSGESLGKSAQHPASKPKIAQAMGSKLGIGRWNILTKAIANSSEPSDK
jgi:hypothetical protein